MRGRGKHEISYTSIFIVFFLVGRVLVGGGNADFEREKSMTWEYQYKWKYNIFRWLAMNMDYIMSVYVSTERKQKFQVLAS